MDNREKGYTLWKKGLKYKEIADKLGVPESTVKSWATRYWKNGKVASEKVASKSKKVATSDATPDHKRTRGGQKGNVNAVGKKDGAPIGNQNAFKHGGYSAILFDTLDEQEKSLIGQMDPNAEQMIVDEIYLLTIRERRILHRINDYKEKPAYVSSAVKTEQRRSFDSPHDEELYRNKIRGEVEAGERMPGSEFRLQTISESSYSIVLKLEEALTRCQSQKQRAIDILDKIRKSHSSNSVSLADDWIAGVLESMEEPDDD